MLIEGVIYALAVLDSLSKRDYGIWPIIRSTKIAVED